MNVLIHRLLLDVHTLTAQKTVNIKKGDTIHKLIVSLSENGKMYQMPEGTSAVFVGEKPDGTIVINDCDVKDNTIEYTITPQTTAATGIVSGEIKLYDANNNLLTSPRFYLMVDEGVLSGRIVSSDEFGALVTATSEAKTLVSNVEKKLENGDFNGKDPTNEQVKNALEQYMQNNPIGQVYIGEDEPTDENVVVWINPDGDETILNDDELPRVFFTGNVNAMTKDDPVELAVSYRSDTENFDGYVEIKWQGSSSIYYPKKNYTIKMFNSKGSKLKKNFCGWGNQNKYCLKANYIDATHARNIISARLWGDVISSREDYDSLPIELRTSPNNGAIDGFPIKLYINGEYQGIYTWNIPKDAWMWNMDDDNPNHAVLCAEINHGAEHPCNFNAPWSGIDGDAWSVEAGTNSETIVNSFNNLIACIKDTTDDEFKATIHNHLDVQSAIDYYIHQITIYGKDNLAKNLLMATYDGVKWYCGAYDMDSTFGMEWDGSMIYPANTPIKGGFNASASLLWERISTLFANEMTERYAELRKTIYTVPNMVTMFERFMDSIGKDLYAEDLEVFPDIPSAEITNIKQLRQFIPARLAFIDKELLPAKPIYKLKDATVFDGTNYINTGVDLDNAEYTVMLDYTIDELAENRGMLIDKINPATNNGWGFYYSSGVPYGGMWTKAWADFSGHDYLCTDPTGLRNRIIIRRQKNGTVTLYSALGTPVRDGTAAIQEGETGMYVTLGAKCWVNENGARSYDSFIKATMYGCEIYDVALSDEECNAYIGEV